MKLKHTNLVSTITTIIRLIVILSIVAFLLISVTRMQQATNAAKVSTYESGLYQHLFFALAQEESLRNAYQVHPASALRHDHLVVATTISQLAQHLQQSLDPTDHILGESIFKQQARYRIQSDQLFAAIDAGNIPSINTIRSKVDPFFYELEQEVKQRASREEIEAAQALEQLTVLEKTISVGGYGILILGLALIGLTMYVTRSYRQKVDESTRAEIARLEHLVVTDPLTGLGNHFAYQEHLSRVLDAAQRGGKPCLLALLDIDEFKILNDEQGHQHGDSILCTIATLLREARLSEALFRLNADDFAVILPLVAQAEAAVPFERFCEQVRHRLFEVTISIGMTWTSVNAFALEEFQAQAALALAEAKRQGRDRVVTFETIESSASFVPLAKRQAVRRVLSEQKLTVVFQPIWNLVAGTVLAYEALIRPATEYGFTGPQELFDIAEQMGRAHELDALCVEKILARAADLPADALLFLNLTPQSLVHDLLTGAILLQAVISAGLEPSRVVLEITERSIVKLADVVQKASLLRLMGFRIALDDAGAGNAGLEMLSQLAIDFVKIDRAVVANAYTDPAAYSVFVGIITIAHEAHISVVAEGIENRELLAFVQQTRVHYVQGYLLGRPSETIPTIGASGSFDAFLLPDKTTR